MNEFVKEIRVKFQNGESVTIRMDDSYVLNENLLSGDVIAIRGYDKDGNYIHVMFKSCDVLFIVDVM